MSAGYIFGYYSNNEKNDSKIFEQIKSIFADGCFGTRNNLPGLHSQILCDYLTMKPGDNIYFFCNRKIYGIGTLIVANEKAEGKIGDNDCIYWDSENAKSLFTTDSSYKPQESDNGNTSEENIHIKFAFDYDSDFHDSTDKEPEKVDMDDVLKYKPSSFRNLRFFSNRTFIQIDDEENQALKEFFYINRVIKTESTNKAEQNDTAPENHFQTKTDSEDLTTSIHDTSQKNESKEERRLVNLKISAKDIFPNTKSDKKEELPDESAKDISPNTESDKKEKRPDEMVLEAHVIEALKQGDNKLTKILGEWDYISHQVVASPFKPAKYIDHMDVFCIRYIGKKGMEHVPCKYLILELKNGELSVNRNLKAYGNGGEIEETLDQLMKYVDWVCQEYANGDYRLIKAAIIANSYNNKRGQGKKPRTIEYNELKNIVMRHSLTETHPIKHESWCDVSLISYTYENDGEVKYEKVADFDDIH